MDVWEHSSTFRHEGLNTGSGRHSAVPVRKKALDVRHDTCVFMQGRSEQVRNSLACDVITSGAEATRRDHQVGPRQTFANRLFDKLCGIRDGHLARDEIAKIRQFAAKPLLMCVENEAQQQFASRVDNLDIHAISFTGQIESSNLFWFGSHAVHLRFGKCRTIKASVDLGIA